MPPKKQSQAQEAAERSKRRRDEEQLSQFSEMKKMLECPGEKSTNGSPRSRKQFTTSCLRFPHCSVCLSTFDGHVILWCVASQ
jgi:hypothetical protein